VQIVNIATITKRDAILAEGRSIQAAHPGFAIVFIGIPSSVRMDGNGRRIAPANGPAQRPPGMAHRSQHNVQLHQTQSLSAFAAAPWSGLFIFDVLDVSTRKVKNVSVTCQF
jgi:hypothetical protein